MNVSPLGLIAITLIPVLALAGLFLMKAKPERGMWAGLGACVLGGLFVVFPGVFIERVLATVLFPSLFNLTTYEPTLKGLIEAFLIAAATEESLKFLVLYLVLQKNEYLQTRFHGLLYGALTGLGFALMENVLYLQAALGSPTGAQQALQMTVGRSNYAVAAHTLLGMVMGYFFLRARRGRRRSEVNFYLGLALVVPFVLHGLYDFLSLSPAENADVWLLALLAGLFGLCVYFGLTEPVPRPITSVFDTIVDDADPVNYLQRASLTLQQKKDLCQELLIREGIKDYLLTDVIFSEPNILVLKAIRLKDFRVETVKMISPGAIRTEGVVEFTEWLGRMKTAELPGLVPYTEFRQTPRFCLLARVYANSTLKDYSPSVSSEAEQADLIFKTAEILQALWGRGVVHGRLTPENVFIHLGGVCLGDVGLHLILAPRERHRAYLPQQEMPMDHYWDLQGLRAITDWLTRGKFAMKPEREEPKYPEQEAVEPPVTALAPSPPTQEELTRILLQKAEKMERTGMLSGATGALILLRRAALTRSDPKIQKKIEQYAMAVYEEAHEAILDSDASLALRKMAQFMEVLPERAEVAAADVESLAEKFVRQGDAALLRHDDRRRAELYYRQALQIQPTLDTARKKIEFLYRPPEFSFAAFSKFLLAVAALAVVTVIATSRFWKGYDVLQMQGFNLQRTGATIEAIPFEPQFTPSFAPVKFSKAPFPGLTFSRTRVYLITEDGEAHALDTLTGALVWEAPIQKGSIIIPVAHPLVCGDRLAVPGEDAYVGVRGGSGRASVFVLDAKNGTEEGELPLTASPRNVLCYRRSLFVTTSDTLTSYALATLESEWQSQEGAPSQPALLSHNVLYVSFNENPGAPPGGSRQVLAPSPGGPAPPREPNPPGGGGGNPPPPPSPPSPSELPRNLGSAGAGLLSLPSQYKLAALSPRSGEAIWEFPLPFEANVPMALKDNILIGGHTEPLPARPPPPAQTISMQAGPRGRPSLAKENPPEPPPAPPEPEKPQLAPGEEPPAPAPGENPPPGPAPEAPPTPPVPARRIHPAILFAFDLARQKVLWVQNTAGLEGYPVIGGDYVFYRTEERFYALSLKTGAIVYESSPLYPNTPLVWAKPYLIFGASPRSYFYEALASNRIVVFNFEKKEVETALTLPATTDAASIGDLALVGNRLIFPFQPDEGKGELLSFTLTPKPKEP